MKSAKSADKSQCLRAALLGCSLLLVAAISAGADEPTPGKDQTVAHIKELGGKFLVTGYKSTWSPTADRIAYGEFPPGGSVRIFDIQTRRGRELAKPGKDPAWSHGENDWIAFVRGDNETEEIWLVKSAGGNPRKVADGGCPDWSPDGKTLYFHSRKLWKIMSLAIDEPNAEPQEFCDLRQSWYPTVSPDGKQVACVAPEGVTVFERQGGKVLAKWPLPGVKGGLVGWSPDGKKVAFGGYGWADGIGLWVLDVASGRAASVDRGPFTQPVYSSDGTKLAVDLRFNEKRHEVWMIETKALESLQPMDPPGK